eukprot:12157267-Alexandrium_andersonii.AAC.1
MCIRDRAFTPVSTRTWAVCSGLVTPGGSMSTHSTVGIWGGARGVVAGEWLSGGGAVSGGWFFGVWSAFSSSHV